MQMPAVDPAALAALAQGGQQGQPMVQSAALPAGDMSQMPTDPHDVLAMLYAKLEDMKKQPPAGQDAGVHIQQMVDLQKEIDQVMKQSLAQTKAKAAFLKAGGGSLNSNPAQDFIRNTVTGGQ